MGVSELDQLYLTFGGEQCLLLKVTAIGHFEVGRFPAGDGGVARLLADVGLGYYFFL